jgi:hypothetical protein
MKNANPTSFTIMLIAMRSKCQTIRDATIIDPTRISKLPMAFTSRRLARLRTGSRLPSSSDTRMGKVAIMSLAWFLHFDGMTLATLAIRPSPRLTGRFVQVSEAVWLQGGRRARMGGSFDGTAWKQPDHGAATAVGRILTRQERSANAFL